MYFIAFGVDDHCTNKTYFINDEGLVQPVDAEHLAYKTWEALTDGGYLGYVLITDLEENILAAISTKGPTFDLDDDWNLTN